jgi:succinate dehydrogenase flavin-adding protein (antitoxin of CptAB toxin-antitoxin module)
MDNLKLKRFIEKELETIADIVNGIYDKLEENGDENLYDVSDVWLSGIKHLINYDDTDLTVDYTAADTLDMLV